MARNINKKKKNNINVSYLNRDFESFRNSIVQFAQTHYKDNIRDFSESSLAGMFVDVAAYVGDVMSFYLDHQFNELSLETAVEEENIERLIRQAGVRSFGASPSVVSATFLLLVDSINNSDGEKIPDPQMLPIIKVGTICESTAGIKFELLSDIDFSKKNTDGEYIAEIEITETNSAGLPNQYVFSLPGNLSSGTLNTETFSIPDDAEAFRTITLANSDVSEIISVTDSILDNYYEVDSLTQNTVYIRETNNLADNRSVPERLRMVPAPKRYVKYSSRNSGLTTLRFGTGNEDTFDEDVIPDPSEHAIQLYGDRKTVNFASIDPNSFLSTRTLGISPRNTTLTVVYRSGGGLSHNVAAGTINSIETLVTSFSSGIPELKISKSRASASIINLFPASGGENEPSLNELKQLAFSSMNLQDRIVTREDMLARIYSLPNNFGRVFRAGIRDNPFNPFASHLHVLSRNSDGKLAISNDSLKENIAVYLKKYRLISDAVDIVDGRIINIGIEYFIKVSSDFDAEVVVSQVNSDLKQYFKIENFQIDQPLYISEVLNIILNTPGVTYVKPHNGETVTLNSKTGYDAIKNLSYSGVTYTKQNYVNNGIYYPLPGGIFEVKFPNDDIRGYVL